MTNPAPENPADLFDAEAFRLSPRAEYIHGVVERCAPLREKAALVFVERHMFRTQGHAFHRYYFPSEGVLIGCPTYTEHSDGTFYIQADEYLAHYRGLQCPPNFRFLDRVAYRYKRGKRRAPGCFELHRLPEVTDIWNRLTAGAVVSYQTPFMLWRVTPEDVATLDALSERREFIFDGRPVPPKRGKPDAPMAG